MEVRAEAMELGLYAAAFLGTTAGELLLHSLIQKKEPVPAPGKKLRIAATLLGNTALLALACCLSDGETGEALWRFGLWSYLAGLSLYDLFCKELPDLWHAVLAAFYLFLTLAGQRQVSIADGLFAALVLGAVLLLIYAVKRDAIGLGDIKLLLLCGMYAGISDAAGMLIRGLFASFAVSVCLLLAKRATAKSELPFAPFLLFGALFL